MENTDKSQFYCIYITPLKMENFPIFQMLQPSWQARWVSGGYSPSLSL